MGGSTESKVKVEMFCSSWLTFGGVTANCGSQCNIVCGPELLGLTVLLLIITMFGVRQHSKQ